MKAKDLTGTRFGRWLVIAATERNKQSYYSLCRCDCGTQKMVRNGDLNNGKNKSCGCLHREMRAKGFFRSHGLSKTAEYKVWTDIKKRCYNSNNKEYANYGGRGITVCDKWLHDFPAFLADMGRRPSPVHSVERLNYDVGYIPDNCVWALPEQQANNKRNNVILELNGRSQTKARWARELGLSWDIIDNRLRNGWSVERTLTTPPLHAHYKPRIVSTTINTR